MVAKKKQKAGNGLPSRKAGYGDIKVPFRLVHGGIFMVVQHNLRAMNSNRMLGITTGQLSKSSEKLSSGYKVNRAADDAAGLSISEKMRKQIRGLSQASANAEDGISAVQTAEGALTEVHDMLQRMNELANKAANGTNSVSDRQTIQDEISQLTTEIDRVAETTKFNEIYLLNGENIGTDDDRKHLLFILENYHGKIIFVVNKLDRFRKKEDSVTATLETVISDLSNMGFEAPAVVPVSSYAAYLAKMSIFAEPLDEDEQDEFDRMSKNDVDI